MANTVTSKGSTVIGRGPLTKLTNGINHALFSTKYLKFMKPGNSVEICSKTSHCALQIVQSRNDQTRLILMGDGPIGPDHRHTHFLIEKNENLKFRNGNCYIAFDNEVPTILSEPTHANPKKHEFIRARNEFRLHEIIGSEENFALESVYFPGRYLAILGDGSVTVSRDKSLEICHFFLHVIAVQGVPYVQPPPKDSKKTASATAPPVAQPVYTDYTPSTSYAMAGPTDSGASAKQQESDNYAAQRDSNNSYDSNHVETPPTYTNLFPSLPK